MTTWLPASLFGLVLGVLAARTFYLHMKEKRVAARRRVEAPNSHYDARGVKDQRDHDRWEEIEIARLHEVNRDYVQELLERVRALGVDHLKADERAFLDRMANLI